MTAQPDLFPRRCPLRRRFVFILCGGLPVSWHRRVLEKGNVAHHGKSVTLNKDSTKMLHFLSWIFLFMKDVRWPSNKGKESIYDIDVRSANRKNEEPLESQNYVDERMKKHTVYDAEQSLDDILTTNSWKTVDGSLQAEAFVNADQAIEEVITAKQSIDDASENTASSAAAGKVGSKVQSVKSFVESVGDVEDGETVKRAMIMKRADSFKNEGRVTSVTRPDAGQRMFIEEPIAEAKDSYAVSSGYMEKNFKHSDDEGGILKKDNGIGHYISSLNFDILQKSSKGPMEGTCESGSVSKPRYISRQDIPLSGELDYDVTRSSGNHATLAKVDHEMTLSGDVSDGGSIADRDTGGTADDNRDRSDSWDSLDLKLPRNHERADKNGRETVTIDTKQKGVQNVSPVEDDVTIGKLKVKSKKTIPPVLNDSPKADFQDFDVIMRKRKLHTDTMQKVSDTFGDFGHREDKIFGPSENHTLSRRWGLVKQAVRSKQYLQFESKKEKTSLI